MYLDQFCLENGVDWEVGFCNGLINSCAFVPLISKDGVHNPQKEAANMLKLTASSGVDNVFLEVGGPPGYGAAFSSASAAHRSLLRPSYQLPCFSRI